MIVSNLDDIFLKQLQSYLGKAPVHITQQRAWHSEGKSGLQLELEISSADRQQEMQHLLAEIYKWEFDLPGYFLADIVAENGAPFIAADDANVLITALLLKE